MLRSLSAVVSITCLCVLGICLLTAHAISTRMEQRYFYATFQKFDLVELADARAALEDGGVPQLQAYLARLDARFGGKHYLLDAQGKRADNGEDLRYMLPPPPQTHSRSCEEGPACVTQLSEDGRYWFVATKPADYPDLSFLRVYVLLTITILALGALLSAYIVFPLRKMAKRLAATGIDTLGARFNSTRKDEIGALANAYDAMAARLEQSFTRERQLLQDVSHELRAPLARMNFSVRLARTAQDREVALDEVKRDLNRLSYLVSELTDLSVGPPGGPDTQLQLVDLNIEKVVADAMRECEPLAEAKSCHIDLHVASQPTIQGDAEHLRRAIGNVLRNATRHSPENRGIQIALSGDNEMALVTIQDCGSGVPPELLKRIFDPFYQVSASRAAADGGLGLGLSIAKRSVEMHGGEIWAENTSPGLRISVKLPTRAALQTQ